jgi:cytidyltransferase-like protein
MKKISGQNQVQLVKDYVSKCHKEGNTVLIVKGVFDLIHPDHIKTLERLSKLADELVVLLIPDSAASLIKPGRPILPESARQKVVSNLKPVKKCFIDYDSRDSKTKKYSKDRDIELLKEISPDMWALSENNFSKFEEYDLGKIELIKYEEGVNYSTTKIISKILEKYAKA